MKTIDLNCDLGEGAGNDEALMPLITSANIACGGHAGDAQAMRATVRLAARHGVGVGAHPGYADRANFGRIEIDLPPDALEMLVTGQVCALLDVARAEGVPVSHVKPHGALYNRSAREIDTARTLARAIASINSNLILVGLAGSVSLRAAAEIGLPTAAEAFADRTYQSDGSLTPRHQPDALIDDVPRAVAQVIDMCKNHYVRATDGTRVPFAADTICLHGDGPHAASFAKAVRAALRTHGIHLAPIARRA